MDLTPLTTSVLQKYENLTILRRDYENENQYAIILTRIWNTYQDPFYSFEHGS